MPLVVVKNRIWEHLRYEPNRAQRRLHARTERNCVLAAGRRTGKSTGNARELHPEIIKVYRNRSWYEDQGKRAEFWCVGPGYSDSEKEFRVLWNDCKRLGYPMDKPGSYNLPDSGNMTLSLWGGTFLFSAKSAAHPDSLVGEGLSGVIMSEAAKMKESVWSKAIRPALADFHGWAKFGSTPEGRNWFFRLWQWGQDPSRVDWWSARFPSWVNEKVFPGGATDEGIAYLKQLREQDLPLTAQAIAASGVDPEIAGMLDDLDLLLFNQEVEAKFSQYVGRVFADWDEEVHGRPLVYDPSLPVDIATDYGWTDPNVALFIQKNVWDDVFVIGEYYRTHRTDDEFADDVLADPYLSVLARKARRLYPDPEDPKASHHLGKKWGVSVQGGTGGELNDRLNLVRRWLRLTNLHLPYGHPNRRPKLFVDTARCPHLAREMDAYRYPDKSGSTSAAREKPMDKDNHAPEALGRWFLGALGGKASLTAPRNAHATFSR